MLHVTNRRTREASDSHTSLRTRLKGAVSSIFSVTMNSPKTYLFSGSVKIMVEFGLQ